jgi:hypothetical protein
MSEQEERCTPFYCGSQSADWETVNCDNCHMRGFYRDQEGQRDFEWRCDIQRAFNEAYMGDGTVSAEIGKRMGADENVASHGWRCPELILIEPVAVYAKRFERPVRRLAPLWKRLRSAWESARETWNPWWGPEEDIYGVMGRIDLRLAWSIAWGLHHDDTEVVRCGKCGRAVMPRGSK